jgi:hypothetical protein
LSANLDFRSTKKKKQSKQIECVFNSYTILMPPIFYHLKTRYFVKNHWLSEKKDIFLRNHPTFTHIQFGFNQISTFWDELLFFICPAAMVILDFRWTKTKLFKRVKYDTFLKNKGVVHIWFNPRFLWKCLYQVRAIAVFPVFQLLTDFVCLLTYEFCLSLWKISRCSVILLLPLCSSHVWLQRRFWNFSIRKNWL